MKKVIKKYIFHCIVVFVLFIAACRNQFNAPIGEGKLIEILADVHLSEAVTQTEIQNVRDSMNLIYYVQIFEHHGVTKTDFDSTMSIYTRNPEQLDSVYSRVERLVKSKRDTLHAR